MFFLVFHLFFPPIPPIFSFICFLLPKKENPGHPPPWRLSLPVVVIELPLLTLEVSAAALCSETHTLKPKDGPIFCTRLTGGDKVLNLNTQTLFWVSGQQ